MKSINHFFKGSKKILTKSFKLLLLGILKCYQWVISPIFPPACRYVPTCSTYAKHAIEIHGPFKGGWLAFKRFVTCHPLGGSGYDPVPPPLEEKEKGQN